MATPTIVPAYYTNTVTDFLKAPGRADGAVQSVKGVVSVVSGTAADAYVGLIPFTKGASFTIDGSSVHCGNFGAATTTVNLGVIYNTAGDGTDDVDAFVSLSTSAQAGGFLAVDEIEGMTLVTTGNGWLALQLKTAAADATANATFNIGVSYNNVTR
jgi:hypothetical protein